MSERRKEWRVLGQIHVQVNVMSILLSSSRLSFLPISPFIKHCSWASNCINLYSLYQIYACCSVVVIVPLPRTNIEKVKLFDRNPVLWLDIDFVIMCALGITARWSIHTYNSCFLSVISLLSLDPKHSSTPPKALHLSLPNHAPQPSSPCAKKHIESRNCTSPSSPRSLKLAKEKGNVKPTRIRDLLCVEPCAAITSPLNHLSASPKSILAQVDVQYM